VRLDSALGTTESLSRQTPQQSLALEAVRRGRGCPDNEVMRRRARYRIDERLQRLSVNVLLLNRQMTDSLNSAGLGGNDGTAGIPRQPQ